MTLAAFLRRYQLWPKRSLAIVFYQVWPTPNLAKLSLSNTNFGQVWTKPSLAKRTLAKPTFLAKLTRFSVIIFGANFLCLANVGIARTLPTLPTTPSSPPQDTSSPGPPSPRPPFPRPPAPRPPSPGPQNPGPASGEVVVSSFFQRCFFLHFRQLSYGTTRMERGANSRELGPGDSRSPSEVGSVAQSQVRTEGSPRARTLEEFLPGRFEQGAQS